MSNAIEKLEKLRVIHRDVLHELGQVKSEVVRLASKVDELEKQGVKR